MEIVYLYQIPTLFKGGEDLALNAVRVIIGTETLAMPADMNHPCVEALLAAAMIAILLAIMMDLNL